MTHPVFFSSTPFVNKVLLIGFCLAGLFSGFVKAQGISIQTQASSGGSYQDSQGSLDWTIGETVTASFVDANRALTQGFQQPTIKVLPNAVESEAAGTVQVYPNPTRSELLLTFGNDANAKFDLVFYDSQGKLIYDQNAVYSGQRLSMTDFAPGNYLLRLKNADKNYTFTIIKLN